MRYILLLVSVVLTFTISCETNWGNYDGYLLEYDSKLQRYIILDKSDTLSISEGDEREGISPYPGAFIILRCDDYKMDTCFFAKGAILIDSYVNEVESNSDFLLIDQTPLGKICECNPECLKTRYGKESYTVTSFQECKKSLRRSNIHDYWIIKKATNEIFGPYDNNKYLLMRDLLKVPTEMKLKSASKRTNSFE